MSAVLARSTLLELQFRPLVEADIPAVVAIEKNVYVFPWTAGNFSDSFLAGYHCWGCWHGENLIGYSIMMTAVEEAHLFNLAVTTPWQTQGIGASMLRLVIGQARKSGCNTMYLEVRPSNIAARRLYDRFGFQQLAVRRDYYPAITGREDALFLGLDLRPSS